MNQKKFREKTAPKELFGIISLVITLLLSQPPIMAKVQNHFTNPIFGENFIHKTDLY